MVTPDRRNEAFPRKVRNVLRCCELLRRDLKQEIQREGLSAHMVREESCPVVVRQMDISKTFLQQ